MFAEIEKRFGGPVAAAKALEITYGHYCALKRRGESKAPERIRKLARYLVRFGDISPEGAVAAPERGDPCACAQENTAANGQ